MRKLIWQNSLGDEINLTKAPFGIINWEGFSNAPLNIQSQQVPMQDGSVFLDALIENRDLSVTLSIQDGNDLEKRYELERELIHILNPKLGEGYLIYSNDFISKRIKCIPQIPLFPNKNSNDPGTQKGELSWTACNPYWEDTEEKEVFFSVGESTVINNEGDVPAQMQIEFFGTSEKSEIQNITTNKKIEVDAEIGDGIVINTNNGKKSVNKEIFQFLINKTSVSLKTLAYSKKLNLFLALGTRGFSVASSDGKNWEKRITSTIDKFINDVIYSEELNLFVAVGNSGAILTSPDGITWTTRTSGTSENLNAITYSESLELFIIVGNEIILTSSDIENWTKQENPNFSLFLDVIYSEDLNLFIVVGKDVLTSSDGFNWNFNYLAANEYMYSVIYSKKLNLLVACGNWSSSDDLGCIWYSSDGNTWLSIRHGVGAGDFRQLRSITYSETLEIFVAVGYKGDCWKSSDGINWYDSRINYVEQMLGKILCVDELNLFITVGDYCTICSGDYNSNKIRWSLRDKGITLSNLFSSCTYSKSLALFVITSNNALYNSSDGKNWTRIETNVYLNDVIYSEELNLFVAVGNSGAILTSPDGITWTTRTSGTSENLNAITYSTKAHTFIAVGNNGIILRSFSGITWTTRTSRTSENLNDVTYSVVNLSFFVAVGNNGVILISNSDGTNWYNDVNFDFDIKSIIFSDNEKKLVAVGSHFSLISFDGENWNKYDTSFNSKLLKSIAFSKKTNCFIAISNDSILKSLDGINWNIFSEKTILDSYLHALNFIFYSEELDLFVAVGNSGTILNSQFLLAENVIQYVSSDSDMSMNLQQGKNQFRLTRENGSLFSRIKYRQKYIGV